MPELPPKGARPPPPKLNDLPDALTIEECAAVLRCTRNGLSNLIQRGEIRASRTRGLTRILKSELVRFCEGRRVVEESAPKRVSRSRKAADESPWDAGEGNKLGGQ
jgi:excisionase family DNA binding protein